MSTPMTLIMLGAIATMSLTSGVLFLRFWRETRDRLFLLFGVAFVVDAASRLGLAFSPRPNEGELVFYVMRLLAFSLIMVAILGKNRRSGDT